LLVIVGLAAGYRMCVWFVFDRDGRSGEEQFVNAIQVGDLEWARRVLANDSTLLEKKDRWGRTPLYIAVSATQNERELAEWLIGLGANVNEPEMNGFTPLYWAAFDGNAELVELLGR
ncbi:MAG: hypothetical protein H6Q78_1178, partial [Candidatus Krumholzibacteriota bacterium]|nr:hypothetical protein [Candidatus Krumholzibacteriota bacterium]